ncbi:hypothetical protein C2E23DRAFT_880805 [Lenzites betulinus]|nr:hypothetical protein C2E23DRAFT_880805 [Lenzites betulinus]
MDMNTPTPRTNTTLTAAHAGLFQHIFRGCAACNIMCMTSRGAGHLRYKHVHRISRNMLVCISRLKSGTSYYAYITEFTTLTTVTFKLRSGVWPVAAQNAIAEPVMGTTHDVPNLPAPPLDEEAQPATEDESEKADSDVPVDSDGAVDTDVD